LLLLIYLAYVCSSGEIITLAAKNQRNLILKHLLNYGESTYKRIFGDANSQPNTHL